jgi:peptidyl-prolyl cis-trans isomerase SurA
MRKNVMKYSLRCLLCLIGFSMQILVHAQDKMTIDEVVATVGQEVIFLSEMEEQYNFLKEKQPNAPASMRCEVLQNLIIQRLLVNQARLDSVEVGEDDIENQLGARVERLLTYFNQDQTALEEYYGMTVDRIKENMRTDMESQLLAERMQAKILADVGITPAEVKAFFKNIPKDSLPYFNSEVEVRELVMKPKVNAVEKAKAREKAEDLKKRIMAGEDFAELAKKYSDDPGSGREGGNLGWMKRGTFVAEFEATLYNLEKEQISDVIETEFGFHIIQLQGRRGNIVQSRHILIKPEITPADLLLTQAMLDSIAGLMKIDSLPFTDAVKKFGNKEAQSFANDGRMTNPQSGNTFFELADLDYEVYSAVEGLQINEVSKPIESRDPSGQKYYRLVSLGSRSKPHKADIKTDYNRIQTAALEQKKAGYTESWMVERLKNTYLDVSPRFVGCPSVQQLKGL